MTRKTKSTRTRGFRCALIAGAFGAVALGAVATATPALADTLGYYYVDPPPTVYVPAPSTTTTTTYTYSSPTYYTAPAPPPVVYRERGPGIYLDTPIINFGVGFH